MRTKWDIKQEQLARAKAAYEAILEEIKWAQETKYEGECSGCRHQFNTEEDFWKHYVVPNELYYNLGKCPNKRY